MLNVDDNLGPPCSLGCVRSYFVKKRSLVGLSRSAESSADKLRKTGCQETTVAPSGISAVGGKAICTTFALTRRH